MKFTQLFNEYRWQFSLTITLILLEAVVIILFPLFIGYAVDDAIEGKHTGALGLGLLGLASLIIGAARRFLDSRFYAEIYKTYAVKIIGNIIEKSSSVKVARVGMIREVIEFMENSFPALVNSGIGLVGVLFIIATLNLKIFIGSLIATFLIFLIYTISGNKTVRLNKAYNDEIEKQVDIIDSKDPKKLKQHVRREMTWNIKLSDLETVNFAISWKVLIIFLVLSIVISIQDGIVRYGALFALIMYVFQYIESVLSLPYFYQNWLRLTEIKKRLKEI